MREGAVMEGRLSLQMEPLWDERRGSREKKMGDMWPLPLLSVLKEEYGHTHFDPQGRKYCTEHYTTKVSTVSLFGEKKVARKRRRGKLRFRSISHTGKEKKEIKKERRGKSFWDRSGTGGVGEKEKVAFFALSAFSPFSVFLGGNGGELVSPSSPPFLSPPLHHHPFSGSWTLAGRYQEQHSSIFSI